MVPRPAAAVATVLVGSVAAHEHGLLLGGLLGGGGGGPSPALLGFQETPLDARYSDVKLAVEGRVPQFLNGTLYRGAPGRWNDGYWLDGLITLNAFRFSEGAVQYSMRWNEDQVYNRTRAGETRPLHAQVAAVRGGTPFPANTSWPTGVAFRQIEGQIMGSTGQSSPNSFDAVTLAPLETPFRFDDNLGAPFLAPTHEQTIDGHVVHHFVTGFTKNDSAMPSYVVYDIKPGTRKRDVLATIEQPKETSPWKGYPSFQHMPLVTKDYYIMIEAPCYYPEQDETSVVGEFDWKGFRANILARGHIRLVSRSTGESTLYPLTTTVFAIHHINAYQEGNNLIIDTIQTFDWFLPCSLAFQGLTMDAMKNDWQKMASGLAASKMVRLVVPLDKPGQTVKPQPLSDVTGVEFPTIRYDELNGKPYQFVYGNWMSRGKASAYYDSIIKVDVKSGKHLSWQVDGHYPGEPIFVPNPDGGAEDDGVLITNVLDTIKKETYLLVLDAVLMTPVARAGPTPHTIPHGFHGRYYDRKLNAAAAGTIDTVVV